MNLSWKKLLTASTLFTMLLPVYASADSLPGEGVTVQPLQSTVAEETFQTLIVNRALEELGYQVKETKEVDYNVGYTSIAKGDATFLLLVGFHFMLINTQWQVATKSFIDKVTTSVVPHKGI